VRPCLRAADLLLIIPGNDQSGCHKLTSWLFLHCNLLCHSTNNLLCAVGCGGHRPAGKVQRRLPFLHHASCPLASRPCACTPPQVIGGRWTLRRSPPA
jgi:hypothetical protein